MAQQTVIITGAGKGIGRATAVRLARGGASLILNARTPADLEAVQADVAAAGGRAGVVLGDAADDAVVHALVQRAEADYGPPTALVTCAAVAPLSPLSDLEPATFDRLLALNIRGMYLITRAVWPLMAQQKRGVIVHVSSMASVDPFPGFAAYGGSKAFVNTFVKGLAAEGAQAGIRLYAVAPGAVDTDMLRNLFPEFPKEDTVPPDAVAQVIADLIEEDSSTPSGETLFVPAPPA